MIYIKAVLPSLNPTEETIANFVLNDPENVLFSSITEVSVHSGVSVASVVAFCRRMSE